jgi:hypothetical protein
MENLAMFRSTTLLALFLAAPSVAFCAGPIEESTLVGAYRSADRPGACSLRITGQSEERFGRMEIFVAWLTLSNSSADRVQLSLRMTGSVAPQVGLAADDNYERVDGARIKTNGSEVTFSSLSGATHSPSGMIESSLDRAVVRPLVDAILHKVPIEISVKPTWQRSDKVFRGIVDLPNKDAFELSQCAMAPALRTPAIP